MEDEGLDEHTKQICDEFVNDELFKDELSKLVTEKVNKTRKGK